MNDGLGIVIIAIILAAIGVLQIFLPDKVHFFARGWFYDGSKELSGLGRASVRIKGVIVVLLSMYILYCMIINY